jgi:hypothetical protein
MTGQSILDRFEEASLSLNRLKLVENEPQVSTSPLPRIDRKEEGLCLRHSQASPIMRWSKGSALDSCAAEPRTSAFRGGASE